MVCLLELCWLTSPSGSFAIKPRPFVEITSSFSSNKIKVGIPMKASRKSETKESFKPAGSKLFGCKSCYIIIWSKLFFLFIGRDPTKWPAVNCLQVMVCSCAMSSNCVWLQIISCSCTNKIMPFSFLRLLLCEKGRSLHFTKIFIKKQTRWLNDKTINYWTWLLQNFVICQCQISQNIVICQISY